MATASRFGRLWGRGHETFTPSLRRIISVKGPSATTYLQGLVTSDLNQDPTSPVPQDLAGASPPPEDDPVVEFNPKLRSTCFLDNKGRILTDAFLWKHAEDHYLVDVPANSATSLLDHLKQYKLRRTKVDIHDVSDKVSSHVIYGTLNGGSPPPGYVTGLDPRHPNMGMRVLSMEHPPNHFPELVANGFPGVPGTYNVLRKFAGIAEGSELIGKTALEANQEWLGAVSFHKGCYLGQELTARTQHTGIIRKRFMPMILVDTQQEIPRPWIMAHQIQEGREELYNELKDQPPLPNLSSPAVGALLTMMTMGSFGHEDEEKKEDDVLALQKESEQFVQEIHEVATSGVKMIDTTDDKAIGQIVATPAPGTSLVLAQMRLDRIGFGEGGSPWSRTNKIRLGDTDKEYRYLPYTPLWWPKVNTATGKAKEEDHESVHD
jgi:folate-binding protein YgfZ